MMLSLLGEENHFSPQAMAYLDNFLSDIPRLLTRLNELGPTLNPKWAHGSAHHLGVLMEQHADRLLKAEMFAPDGNDRRLS